MHTKCSSWSHSNVQFSVWATSVTYEGGFNLHEYKANLVFHVELMKNNPSGFAKTTDAYFRSDVMTILSVHAINVAVQKAFTEIEKRIEKWTREGSGWTVTKVRNVYLDFAKYTSLKVSLYIDLSKFLKKKKAIEDVQNTDQQCLKWAWRFAIQASPQCCTLFCSTQLACHRSEKLEKSQRFFAGHIVLS